MKATNSNQDLTNDKCSSQICWLRPPTRGRRGLCSRPKRRRLLFRRPYDPSEFQIHPEIPQAGQKDGDQICQVNIQMQKINLAIQQQNADADSGQANQVKPAKAPHPRTPAAFPGGKILKSPPFVPDEVVYDGGFSGAHFAEGKRPAEHSWIGQQKQNPHVHHDPAGTHQTKADESFEGLEVRGFHISRCPTRASSAPDGRSWSPPMSDGWMIETPYYDQIGFTEWVKLVKYLCPVALKDFLIPPLVPPSILNRARVSAFPKPVAQCHLPGAGARDAASLLAGDPLRIHQC